MNNTFKISSFLIIALYSITVSAETLQCPVLEKAHWEIGELGREIWQLGSQDSAIWETIWDLQVPYCLASPPHPAFGADIKVTAFLISGDTMKCRYEFPLKEGAYTIKCKKKIEMVGDMANWVVSSEHVNPNDHSPLKKNKERYKCETTGADLGKCMVTTE